MLIFSINPNKYKKIGNDYDQKTTYDVPIKVQGWIMYLTSKTKRI